MNKEFRKMVEKYRLTAPILQKIENRMTEKNGKTFSLTKLQSEVFQDERFWNTEKNVIIQGATSSGKTLISEIAAIYCMTQSLKNQVIVLVPLKAMVRERCKMFQEDMGNKRVFAASSDYQDHDDDLLQGDYDIAVIVYEKFFALIAQSDSKLIERCGLLIVDEIQMLSSKGRGPKLEFSLQRILQWYRGIRIMGLTTSDAEVDYLRSWMDGAEKFRNDSRPVGLEEIVISVNGDMLKRIIKGENDLDREEYNRDINNPIEEKLELATKFSERASRNEKKENLLINLLRNIIREDEKNKKVRQIVVFTNSRNRTRKIAKLIANSNLIHLKSVPSELLQKIDEIDSEDSQVELLRSLLPYGVAFHNSALSVSLRQVIEDDFSDLHGTINIIVATETLTIGMNMPTDIMILFDKTVYRGDHAEHELSTQEYKNFIGRAGRYGLVDQRGQSFLFVFPDELEECWRKYVYPQPTPIISSLLEYRQHGDTNIVASVHAPYYLNLITNRPLVVSRKNEIQTELLEQLEKESFSNCCDPDKGKIKVDDMLKWLKRAKVLEIHSDPFLMEEIVRMVKFGESMAPYALSCRTCYMIYTYLVHDGLEEKGNGGLPYDITQNDIASDKYLLDILFQICLTSEVMDSANLNAPEDNLRNADRFAGTVDALLKFLNKYRDENTFWPNSALEARFYEKDTPETDDINALIRAVVLLHWTKGDTITEIKKNTGLQIPLIRGDIERIAEVSSYLIEAVSKSINCASQRLSQKLAAEFYRLSTRVKYGMKRELVVIANRHIMQLDRKVILDLGRVYDKYRDQYENIVVFLKEAPDTELEGSITQQMREQIVDMIDQRYLHDSLEILVRKMTDDGILEKEQCEILVDFSHPQNQEEQIDNGDGFELWIDKFEEIVKNILHFALVPDPDMGKGYYFVESDGKKVCFYLTLKTDELEKETEDRCIKWYKDCCEKFNVQNLIIIGKAQATGGKNNEILVISASNFCGVVAQYIVEKGSAKCCWNTELMELLSDYRGGLKGYGCSNLQFLVQNYIKKFPNSDILYETNVLIICDRSFSYFTYITEVQNILIKKGLSIKQLIWTQESIPENFNGIIVFFLAGNYIWHSKSVLYLAKKHSSRSFALWYLDEDKVLSKNAGFNLKGKCTTDAEQAAEYVMGALKSICDNSNLKYDVGISYKHHEGDDRMLRLAEFFAEIYGKDRVLFDKFHPELFLSNGDGKRIEELFRTQCYYVIVGVTNDYEEGGWTAQERRGFTSMSLANKDVRRLGYVILEDIDPSKVKNTIDFRIDGEGQLFDEDDHTIKKLGDAFCKNIDEAKIFLHAKR